MTIKKQYIPLLINMMGSKRNTVLSETIMQKYALHIYIS